MHDLQAGIHQLPFSPWFNHHSWRIMKVMTKDFFHQSLSTGIKHRKYPKLFKHLQHQTEQREKVATERLQFENLSVFFQPNAAKYMWMKTVGAAEAKGTPYIQVRKWMGLTLGCAKSVPWGDSPHSIRVHLPFVKVQPHWRMFTKVPAYMPRQEHTWQRLLDKSDKLTAMTSCGTELRSLLMYRDHALWRFAW